MNPEQLRMMQQMQGGQQPQPMPPQGEPQGGDDMGKAATAPLEMMTALLENAPEGAPPEALKALQSAIAAYQQFLEMVMGGGQAQAPQGDMVDYEKLHQFIVFLRESRFKIRYITFDQYNSVGPMQMLIKNNFEVGNLSVDRNDLAYIYLRDMIINKSISMYKNKHLEKELIHLTHSFVNGKAKVDHPVAFSDGSKGSKDMADATAGVVFNAMELLTNAGKFPDTSNTELSKGIIQNLFPAFKVDELPAGNVFSETEQIKQYISFRSPFEK